MKEEMRESWSETLGNEEKRCWVGDISVIRRDEGELVKDYGIKRRDIIRRDEGKMVRDTME